jgi:hypothetical protein
MFESSKNTPKMLLKKQKHHKNANKRHPKLPWKWSATTTVSWTNHGKITVKIKKGRRGTTHSKRRCFLLKPLTTLNLVKNISKSTHNRIRKTGLTPIEK